MLFLLILGLSCSLAENKPLFFIVWDIGQGSWATGITPHQCVHFDMGGQYAPDLKKLYKYCKNKDNILTLSHLDKDHVRFVPQFFKHLGFCLYKKKTFNQKKWMEKIRDCTKKPDRLLMIYRSAFKNRNDSHIYTWDNQVLITGDAHKAQELSLRDLLTHSKIRMLVVGHHGSKTSSHRDFISRLRRLHQAIVSAKHKTYRHPHSKTRATFKENGLPLLETEDFGTLVFEL